MKALTLWQPWATLVAIGAKRIETRSWKTSYRGRLAIHAAKKFRFEDKGMLIWEPWFSALLPDGYTEKGIGMFGGESLQLHVEKFPLGCVIATCDLVSVRLIEQPKGNHYGFAQEGKSWYLTDQEQAFGDFTPGRYAWLLDNIVMLPEPIPAKGFQLLWEWTI